MLVFLIDSRFQLLNNVDSIFVASPLSTQH